MKRTSRHRYIRAVGAIVVFVVAGPAVHADVTRTGNEPWCQQATAEARAQAQAVFDQAIDKHLQLLRGDAMELYEQALALCDNPDIRWNLALVLDDMGEYLPAHQQLERALQWDTALGVQRLGEVRERMRMLETQRLARIEAQSDEPGADIRLDGQPWFRGSGSQSALVTPGMHYIAATKPGFAPTTASVLVAAGERYRVTLRMAVDRLIETRRWSVRMPWTVVAAGAAVAVVGAVAEWQALAHRDAAVDALARGCDMRSECPWTRLQDSDRAVMDHRIAIGAFVAGGTAVAAGMVLAWLNQPKAHRSEAPGSPVELIPTVSAAGAAVSARVRF
jgi:hypothetical protein